MKKESIIVSIIVVIIVVISIIAKEGDNNSPIPYPIPPLPSWESEFPLPGPVVTAEERQWALIMDELFQLVHDESREEYSLIGTHYSAIKEFPYGTYLIREKYIIPIEQFKDDVHGSLELISWSWKNRKEVVLFSRFNESIIAQWIPVERWSEVKALYI